MVQLILDVELWQDASRAAAPSGTSVVEIALPSGTMIEPGPVAVGSI